MERIELSVARRTGWPENSARSTRRLVVGVAFSVAVHGLLITGMQPMTVAFPLPRPLQVELLGLATTPETSAVVSAHSEFPVLFAPTPHSASAKPEQARLSTGAEQVAGPNLRFTPDQYYTARELDVRAEPVNEVPLIYPRLAYQNRTGGKVLLRILINERGGVDQVLVLEAEPRGIFEEAALAATQPLQFSPALRNRQPVKSQKVIEVNFDPYESIRIP